MGVWGRANSRSSIRQIKSDTSELGKSDWDLMQSRWIGRGQRRRGKCFFEKGKNTTRGFDQSCVCVCVWGIVFHQYNNNKPRKNAHSFASWEDGSGTTSRRGRQEGLEHPPGTLMNSTLERFIRAAMGSHPVGQEE